MRASNPTHSYALFLDFLAEIELLCSLLTDGNAPVAHGRQKV
jgi:hypothetical protein